LPASVRRATFILPLPGITATDGGAVATRKTEDRAGRAGTASPAPIVSPTDEFVRSVVDNHRGRRGALISILDEIQTKEGYLPEHALRRVAELMGRTLVDVYGVATFYKAFRLTPRGKHLVSVCLGTACHVRGAAAVARALEDDLEIQGNGATTADHEVTLEEVRCVGACALGPILVIDGDYSPHVDADRAVALVRDRRTGVEPLSPSADERVFPVEVNCPRCNHSLMDPDHLVDGHPSVRFTISFGKEHGWVRLSSLYGSYAMEAGGEVPADEVAHFFCPHCHGDLMGGWNCTACGAPMVPVMVNGGGMVQICSRRGCRSHLLDLEGDTEAAAHV
jgi:NADH-quinone oxidoreductase subunit E